MTNHSIPFCPEVVSQFQQERPSIPVGLLSRSYKLQLIERAIVGYYNAYTKLSQDKRNWNPHTSFDWKKIRIDHTDELMKIIRFFYAVEQYVPDFVAKLLRIIRKSQGRSHFHLRWGSEEEKHSELWLNALLFSKRYTPKQMDDYGQELLANQWELPFDNEIEMVAYTVFQELATQVNYRHLRDTATGLLKNPTVGNATDPLLAEIAATITMDESAHYGFFVEVLHLFLYYFPSEALAAVVTVMKGFAMPAGDIIPDYAEFQELAYKSAIYGIDEYKDDVIHVALTKISVSHRKDIIRGIKRIRQVPDFDGTMHDSTFFDSFDEEGNAKEPLILDWFHLNPIEKAVKSKIAKVAKFEQSYGFDKIDPLVFIPNY